MTDAKIFLVNQTDRHLTPIAASDYIDEDQLQRYLEDYPDLLAGDQIDPNAPRRWLLVAREMGVPDQLDGGDRWSIDHFFLDQDGTPTFVECKRAVDTRTRREVVAQMLDYASNGAAHLSVDRVRQIAGETAAHRGADLDELIADLIDDDSAEATDAYWQTVEEKLRNGEVRLLFVVDQAPPELRRIVEFLNDKMADVQVLIVELKQYTGAGQTALVPRVLGQSQKTADRKRSAAGRSSTLTREEFLDKCSPQGGEICRQLWAAAEQEGYEIVARGTCFAIRIKRPRRPGYSTLLLTYHGNEPGDEFIDFHLDHVMRNSVVATDWSQRLIGSNLFENRGRFTSRSHKLDDITGSALLDLCIELLKDGPALVSEQPD